MIGIMTKSDFQVTLYPMWKTTGPLMTSRGGNLSLIRENPELSAKQVTRYYSASKQNLESKTDTPAVNR
jgi:hypothetical protein